MRAILWAFLLHICPLLQYICPSVNVVLNLQLICLLFVGDKCGNTFVFRLWGLLDGQMWLHICPTLVPLPNMIKSIISSSVYFQASWLPWSKSWWISTGPFCRRHWGSSGTEIYSNGEARKPRGGSGPKRNLQEMWGWCDLECEAQILISNTTGNVCGWTKMDWLCGYGNRLYHNFLWENPFLTRTLGYNIPKTGIIF